MKLFTRIREAFARRSSDANVVRKYLAAGGRFGDAVSCLYMGECIGFGKLLDTWAFWEREYARRDYRTVTLDEFVSYGGYGKPIETLHVGRRKDEPAILHAERYRDRYLGKVVPAIDMDAMMRDGQPQIGTYAIPSTDDEGRGST